MEKKSAYNLLIVLSACVGSFTYGYVISVLATTLSKPDFYKYMGIDTVGPGKGYANAIIAAWNSLLYVGAVFGGALHSFVSNRWGRKMPIIAGASLTAVGGAMQAGTVNSPMLAVARVIIGFGIGFILPAIPLYQAEVAPPHARGLMVGLHGSALGFGNMVAQLMGLAFFKSGGQISWRVPLAIQCFPSLILLCLTFIMPESPRWLYAHGKTEQAKAIMIRLHKDQQDPTDAFALHEFRIMKAQIDLEMQKNITIWQALQIPSVRRRFILGFVTMLGTQCSGLLVLLMGGYFAVTIGLIGATILTKLFAGTDTAGNRASTFFIFWIIVVYTIGIEAASFVYTSEIFPTELRAQGVDFSMQGLFLSSVLWTAVASPALSAIGYYFYIVFICTSTIMFFIIFFYFPETKGYTLEQLCLVFGDEVVDDEGHLPYTVTGLNENAGSGTEKGEETVVVQDENPAKV
ncbi:hypothetical protein ACEPPN_009288 [Leptodophora sp. 'Broadleaf-Isolate-01']